MKKLLVVAFAGLCVASSIMATTAGPGKFKTYPSADRMTIRDTVPGKKSDTSSYPKRDTSSMPRVVDVQGK